MILGNQQYLYDFVLYVKHIQSHNHKKSDYLTKITEKIID